MTEISLVFFNLFVCSTFLMSTLVRFRLVVPQSQEKGKNVSGAACPVHSMVWTRMTGRSVLKGPARNASVGVKLVTHIARLLGTIPSLYLRLTNIDAEEVLSPKSSRDAAIWNPTVSTTTAHPIMWKPFLSAGKKHLMETTP